LSYTSERRRLMGSHYELCFEEPCSEHSPAPARLYRRRSNWPFDTGPALLLRVPGNPATPDAYNPLRFWFPADLLLRVAGWTELVTGCGSEPIRVSPRQSLSLLIPCVLIPHISIASHPIPCIAPPVADRSTRGSSTGSSTMS